jgi:chromosomal replication initiator protein
MNITAKSVWTNCLKFVKDNIQPQAYKTWFEPIQAVKLIDKSLSIQVPSKFFYEWLEEHYVKLLKVALRKELGEDAKLDPKRTIVETTLGATAGAVISVGFAGMGAAAQRFTQLPKNKIIEIQSYFVSVHQRRKQNHMISEKTRQPIGAGGRGRSP